MTLLEALVPIIAIIAVFGVSGLIIIKLIQLVRDWIIAKRTPLNVSEINRRMEQYEMQQEQLVKRIRNLETNLMDSGSDQQKEPPFDKNKSMTGTPEQEYDRPLKNKLRT